MSLKIDIEDDRSSKLWWFALCRHELLYFVAELQRMESLEISALEFHRLTINSVEKSVLCWTLEPRQLVIPDNIWKWFLVHLSKAWHRIWENKLRVRETEDFLHQQSISSFHEESSKSIVDTINIISLSAYNLSNMSPTVSFWDFFQCFRWNINFLRIPVPRIQMLVMSTT